MNKKKQNHYEKKEPQHEPTSPIEVIDLESSPSDQQDNSSSDQELSLSPDNEANENDDDEAAVEPSTTTSTGPFGEFDMTFDQTQLNASPSTPLKEYEHGIKYRKYNSSSILVTMSPGADLYFVGKAQIQVLKGTVSVYGSHITKHEPKRQLFSPQGHSLLCVRCVTDKEQDHSKLLQKARVPEFLETDAPESKYELSEEELESDFSGVAVFILEAFENTWTHGFRKYGTDSHLSIGPEGNGIGPGPKTPKLKEFMDKLGFAFVSQFQLERKRLYQESEEWDIVYQGLDTIDLQDGPISNHRIGIFGGKGVGKSTFTRWLTNQMLRRLPSVLYIDLDPGQTEFTPAGLISVVQVDDPILGPNFTHLKEGLISFFTGTVDVCSQPMTYYNAMKQLKDYLDTNASTLGNIPWVINTMGFTKGLGVDFACESIKIFHPNLVVQFHIEDEGRCYPFLLRQKEVNSNTSWVSTRNPNPTPVGSYPFYLIASVCENKGPAVRKGTKNQWGLTPKQLRENVMVSYFAPVIGSRDLLSIQPICVSLKNIAVGTSPSSSSFLSYPDKLASINGNLVALCKCPPEFVTSDSEGNKSIIPAIHQAQPSLPCLGYGIVRAIDTSNATLFLITPLCLEKLEESINCVISAGAIGLPIQFYLGSLDGSHTPGKKSSSELLYVMPSKGESSSKLHSAARRQFVPNRIAHNPTARPEDPLKKCLL